MISIRAIVLVLAVGAGTTCGATVQDEETARDTMSPTDINDVLRAHDDELLEIPGVEGVYVGLLDDGETPCIKIMVVDATPELEERLPDVLDGHPVVIEETGAIQPLDEG